MSLYKAVDKVGVNRVGIADTVGCASPRQVYDVRILRATPFDIQALSHSSLSFAHLEEFPEWRTLTLV